MGFLDVLKGMYYGPRGKPAPNAKGGGMSPITMALLALLAYKAFKGRGPFSKVAQGSGTTPGAGAPPTANGRGMADMLRGGLGGLLAGGAAGTILQGGLSELMQKLRQNGKDDVARSWVGTGPNKSIDPQDLARTLGSDVLDALSQHTGMPRDQLLQELSNALPKAVDSLTPQGRVPTEQELARAV
ncbi:MAG TPA: YidB family protein [Xanthobacteraceae bacterium]|jgi:uncharacterized protein YidB (DUF937 family)